jgi:DNA-binding transcriptional MerR regulator
LGIFSIKDIEALTGIKCHTLRIWEQRYGIIVPKRSETNIRYYDDQDLKTLLNISVLNDSGLKISEIAKFDSEEIAQKVVELSSATSEYKIHIRSFIAAMMSFDELGFHKLLNTYIIQFGFEETFLKIVFPFLQEVGLLWQVGTLVPSHEHFVSNIIKQKLYVAIDGQVGKPNLSKKKFLLFLPEFEKHSLGLLFANYIIRSRGQEVLFLGQEVPLTDLREAFEKHSPDFILTLMTIPQHDMDKHAFVKFLTESWPKSTILISGHQFVTENFEEFNNVIKLTSFNHLIELVSSLGQPESKISAIS